MKMMGMSTNLGHMMNNKKEALYTTTSKEINCHYLNW